MRIVFTIYAINSAGLCFLMTFALMVCDEYSSNFDYFLNYLVEYMFILFGPVLFLLCILGLVQSPYTKDCSLHYKSVNMT